MARFSFFCPTRIAFGSGVRMTVSRALKQNRWDRAGVVIDHNLDDNDPVASLMNSIKDTLDHVVEGWCTVSEPTYNDLEEMRKRYMGQDLQVIIGIGGGSALDMAKAMAVLVHNKEPSIKYRGFDKMTKPVLPIIAIPTTAGTGSEVTPNASFIDSDAKKKLGINGEAVRPLYSFLDPELTLSCPKEPTISAAVDSLVHATEAYIAKKTTIFARLFALEGFRRVYNNLLQIISYPHDLEIRSEIMYGAFLSGIALMHSGTGPAAAMSYPLGVHYHVPHGIGGGIFLPHIVAHNVSHGITTYADFYQVIDGVDTTLSRSKQAEHFTQDLLKTLRQVGILGDLSQYGFSMESIDSFIAETMELKGALDQNPVPFYQREISKTLKDLGG